MIDWYSRYVLSWQLSNTLDGRFSIDAFEEALSKKRKPEICNTDQGWKYTSNAFTSRLKDHKIRISIDGRSRALDNVFIERLWRTVKYEDIYLRSYESPWEWVSGLARYCDLYRHESMHSSWTTEHQRRYTVWREAAAG